MSAQTNICIVIYKKITSVFFYSDMDDDNIQCRTTSVTAESINNIVLTDDDFKRLKEGEWLNCKVSIYVMYCYRYQFDTCTCSYICIVCSIITNDKG